MKIYTVCAFSDHEGCDNPEVVFDTPEAAKAYIDTCESKYTDWYEVCEYELNVPGGVEVYRIERSKKP